MKMKMLGKKTGENDGKKWFALYVSEPGDNKKSFGDIPAKKALYVDSDFWGTVKPGDMLDVEYNSSGYLHNVEKI